MSVLLTPVNQLAGVGSAAEDSLHKAGNPVQLEGVISRAPTID